jgi:hypothetical protein
MREACMLLLNVQTINQQMTRAAFAPRVPRLGQLGAPPRTLCSVPLCTLTALDACHIRPCSQQPSHTVFSQHLWC